MIAEFHYQLGWRSQAGYPGRHPGPGSGGGFEFEGFGPLLSHPDPRNLDLRATIADPFGQLMVKRFHQRAAVPVYLLADLSASMGFQGQTRKTALLAEFAAAAAWSAWRSGDPFGFYACDNEIRWDLSLPLGWRRDTAAALQQRLKDFRPAACDASALSAVAPYLGRRRALVFLVSDFHLPGEQLGMLLQGLARHDLAPVVLWDSGEYENLPAWGLAQLQDPETGRRRRLFLRAGFREKLRQRYAARREELTRIFGRHGREPFFIVDRFDADAMTRYFYQS